MPTPQVEALKDTIRHKVKVAQKIAKMQQTPSNKKKSFDKVLNFAVSAPDVEMKVKEAAKSVAKENLQQHAHNISHKSESLFDQIWNNIIFRIVAVHDFYALGFGFNGIAGAGSATTIELRWITRGNDASFLPALTITTGVGGGYSLDVTLNIETAHYTGDPRNITRKMLETNSKKVNGDRDFPTIWGNVGIAEGGKIGLTGYITPMVDKKHHIIGGELNIGGGLPAGPLPGNISGGVSNTYIVYDFYE